MVDRCGWCKDDPTYIAYHDLEWGRPLRNSRALWELLILEGFQAGLSWITILRRRDNFRAAFAGFDPDVIAGWDAAEVTRLLADPGIIRHRGKIEATIGNARAWQACEADQGFATLVWSYVGGTPLQGNRATLAEVPAQTPLSVQMSNDLKRRGFKFCGPTITYAFMQAAGMVNDHVTACHCHAGLARGDHLA